MMGDASKGIDVGGKICDDRLAKSHLGHVLWRVEPMSDVPCCVQFVESAHGPGQFTVVGCHAEGIHFGCWGSVTTPS